MDCDHLDVRWTTELVPVSHMVSVCNWFTCEVCGTKAVVVVKTQALPATG